MTNTYLLKLQSAIGMLKETVTDELISNLEYYCDCLEIDLENDSDLSEELSETYQSLQEEQEKNRVLCELLKGTLSHEEMIDIRIRYGVDIEWGC